MTSVHPIEQPNVSKKYRSYAAEVEKALKVFEATSEWPDLINALAKLSKALNSSKQFSDIPKIIFVSKRISQCLHPTLPMGVHRKALETCNICFDILNRGDQLVTHLYLFGFGLFPLMEKCGIKVKSDLLDLFDKFLVPLGPKLGPALSGFLVALLFALEEGSEFYSRTSDLLDRVMEKSGPIPFYACLWHSVLGVPAVRLPALLYVNNKFDRRKPAGDQLALMCGGPDHHSDYLIAALCAAAEDPGTALIQRNLLDFLCAAIPLNSDHVVQADLVQILRRCLFVVLRRDMSLNRRLYQWLLNRSNEASLNLGGAEELTDLDFFKTYSIPLVRQSIADFMQLETVEVSTQPSFYTAGDSLNDTRDVQVQFTEVRLCRLLHYFLDRPELGMPIVRETLVLFLEYACRRDPDLVKKLQIQCEQVDSSFSFGPFWDSLFNAESKLSTSDKIRRLEDIRKNLNSLLGLLEPGFLWDYLGELFVKLLQPLPFKVELTDEEEENLTIEERERRRYTESKRREHLMLYPLMVVFCIQNAQLDRHDDIRGRHISQLLHTLLTTIREHGCEAFSRDNLVALLCVARRLLYEVSQSVSTVETDAKKSEESEDKDEEEEDNNESMTDQNQTGNYIQLKDATIAGQKLVESCLTACRELFIQICSWYLKGRERDKTGVLCAISLLIRDFADFPIYCLTIDELNVTKYNRRSSTLSNCSTLNDISYSSWLGSLMQVVDIQRWYGFVHNIQEETQLPQRDPTADFEVRARLLDLLLFLYVKSISILEQHVAVSGRNNRFSYAGSSNQKNTTTILLKTSLAEVELAKLEEETVFRHAASVLWVALGETNESINAQTVANLLSRLHSRRGNDTSSDVEDFIVSDLTSSNKRVSGLAAKKFRILWTLNRTLDNDSYHLPKPFNRVVMVFLGYLTDDLATSDCAELRAVAATWFLECAKHNDLHRILQMLFLMLLTPASARVSMQAVQLEHRVTRDQVPSLPVDVNAVALQTVYSKQTFHHVCRDIDVPLEQGAPRSYNAPWNNFSFIDCTRADAWIGDLKKHTLASTTEPVLNGHFRDLQTQGLHSAHSGASLDSENNFMDASMVAQPRTPFDASKTSRASPPGFIRSHKRTVSDIPQFDPDVDSVGSLSLDETLDPDVLETLQMLVDAVCLEEEEQSVATITGEEIEEEVETADDEDEILTDDLQLNHQMSNGSLSNHQSITADKLPLGDSLTSGIQTKTFEAEDDIAGPLPSIRSHAQRSAYHTKKRDNTTNEVSNGSVNSAPSSSTLHAISRMPESIKRVKGGHRRQDSLQETIFSTSTQELHLFDQFELPTLTSPGDAKQPMLDESHAHMLFYTESPRVVDLGRAEKIFRILTALLRSESSLSMGRLIVSTMIFTDIAKLLGQSPASAQSVQLLVDALTRHYRHVLGRGYWNTEDDGPKSSDEISGASAFQDRLRSQTFFEIFCNILLYYLRSYYLNSPMNAVSTDDLALSSKCKVACLECCTELMKVATDLVVEMESREFSKFVESAYRQTRAQRVVISLMLTIVPTPPKLPNWRMPVTVDIAEFNNGPPGNEAFRGLAFAFQRSLLNLASVLIVMEFKLLSGQRNFPTQNLSLPLERIHENRQIHNTPQNRSNLREPRFMVVELKMFIGVVLNALRRCTDRHELWLNFIVSCVPYLDRTLATFSVHLVDQLCRNIYSCVSANFAGLSGVTSDYDPYDSLASEPPTPTAHFDDYRFQRTDAYSALSASNSYPMNYALSLFEALTTIIHYGMIESYSAAVPFLLMRTSFANSSHSSHQQKHHVVRHPSLMNPHKGHDSNSSLSLNMSSVMGSAFSAIPGGRGASEFVSNIIGKVFTSNDNSGSTNSHQSNATINERKSSDWLTARLELIKKFPGILAVIGDTWYFASHGVKPRVPVGEPGDLCALILDLLGPIAKKQPDVLLSSAAIVWPSRGKAIYKKETDEYQPSFDYTTQQQAFAGLCLKVLSFAEIVNACLDLLKESSTSGKASVGTGLSQPVAAAVKLDSKVLITQEASLLEFLHCAMQCLPTEELRSAWAALSVLFNEVQPSSLTPRGCFLQFAILSDFVKLCGSQTIIDDRTMSRNCQDACQRITEALNSIIGWQLESTTWLKRTLVVRQDANQKLPDLSPSVDYKSMQGSLASEANSIKGSRSSLTNDSNRLSSTHSTQDATQLSGSVAQLSTVTNDSKKSSTSTLRSSVKDTSNQHHRRDPANSTQALFLLADNLTELIDSICRSEDKDRLIPTLQAVWGNTLPYLKAKSARNVRFFLASSQFLASMSTFNYMRPVWKKAAMELLFDSSFFKMDLHALKHWLVVIDNLMTNDKTSFKELLTKIPSGTSTALSNLMTSKEQEYEMRAQSLKRLAFVILSSQLDQYCSIPTKREVQEKLADNLRQSQVPLVHTQVFVCYRVLLIRMRPNNLSAVWPAMVTELVQVLLQIEHHLQTASVEELRSPRDEQLMQLFLAACKFLETLCTLPSGYVTLFQMSHWSFVPPIKPDPKHELFVPFATRLDALLTQKFGELTENDRMVVSASLCSVKTLTGVHELHPFFHALAQQHESRAAAATGTPAQVSFAEHLIHTKFILQEEQLRDACYITGTMSLKSAIQRLEQALYVDFADHWQL
ncbi:Protein pad-1 [Aphelenchoides besseyi]|nr:Protein pad-1 [Aphelenchoides besseyi]